MNNRFFRLTNALRKEFTKSHFCVDALIFNYSAAVNKVSVVDWVEDSCTINTVNETNSSMGIEAEIIEKKRYHFFQLAFKVPCSGSVYLNVFGECYCPHCFTKVGDLKELTTEDQCKDCGTDLNIVEVHHFTQKRVCIINFFNCLFGL